MGSYYNSREGDAEKMEAVKCPECGKTFKNKAGLAGHLSIVHGKNGSMDQKMGCQHIWRRLNNSELKMVDEKTGKSIYELGFLFVCRECGELR